MVTIRSNERLWKHIVDLVKRGDKGGKKMEWSARKAQLAVSIYKKMGGKYKNKKSLDNSLVLWTKQDWRTKSGKNSVVGKLATGERYLPSKAIKKLSDKEYELVSSIKRMSIKRGKQYSKQPKNIVDKIRRYRRFGSNILKKERVIDIIKSPVKHKKYRAILKDIKTGSVRNIDFGDNRYEQYKDSTKLGLYSYKDHGDIKRKKNYYRRHSKLSTKKDAIYFEFKRSGGYYNAKILSHIYLW